MQLADAARIGLAGVRLTMGTTALLAPRRMVTQLGGDPDAQGQAVYALRLFGIRTVLLAADLVLTDGVHRSRALALAPLVHATDTASALLARQQHVLPEKAANTAVAVSGTNTVLSLLALRGQRAT